jgi:hypothetical protein
VQDFDRARLLEDAVAATADPGGDGRRCSSLDAYRAAQPDLVLATARVTRAEVIEMIVWLRQQYHFGPAKIAMYLARYHDVTISS